jgi:hypothetical protein
LLYRVDALIFQALRLTKSRIVWKAIEAQWATCVAKLENDNAQLRVELEIARSKLAEVEGRERALTSAYEEVKKDFNDLSSSHNAVLKEKAETDVEELRHETEVLVATLRGQCAVFPIDASVSDFLGWFQAEIADMPMAFTECNENITCYAPIGVLQMLAGEGCVHVSELKKLALSYDALLIQQFPGNVCQTARKLVKDWWTNHGLPYCMQKIEEVNQVSSAILLFQ